MTHALARKRAVDPGLAKPRAANAAGQCRHRSSKPFRPTSTSAPCRQDSGLSAPGEIAALLAREKARSVSSRRPGRFVVGADQTLALGERLFSKPARARAGRRAIARACRQHAMNCIPPLPWRVMARYCSQMSALRRMTMRRLGEGRDRGLSGSGRSGRYVQRRRLSARRVGRAFVRAHRRRSFHHPRPAAAAAAGVSAQRAAAGGLKSRHDGDGEMLILGLTGSIGMGKSTTAKLFAEAGVPVYDADAAVHKIYEGEAAPAIEAAFPGTTADGKVDRAKLSAQVVHDPAAMKQLEQIVHPMLRRFTAEIPRRRRTIRRAGRGGRRAAAVRDRRREARRCGGGGHDHRRKFSASASWRATT